MRLYFASVLDPRAKRACSALGVRNYLLSFGLGQQVFDRNSDILENPERRVIVDSGAFSAWNKGVRIDIKKYADFAQGLREQARCELIFVNLDVIPGRKGARPTEYERDISAEQSFNNWQYLHEQGIPTMNVFHQHEGLHWLDGLQKHSNYIGISPANDVSVHQRDRWLEQVFQLLGSSVKTHGFGIATSNLLLRYPFFSVDATTWLGGAKYGSSVSMNLPKCGVNQIRLRDRLCRQAKDALALTKRGDRKYHAGIRKFLQFEEFVSDVWRSRGIESHGSRPSDSLPDSGMALRSTFTPTRGPEIPEENDAIMVERPLRKPRHNKEERRKDRLAKLESGYIKVSRADRWAARGRIASIGRLRLADWLLYAIYEHLIDLASPTGESAQLEVRLYFWELAEDLRVSTATIGRWIQRLEDLGLLRVDRTTSDCSPNVFTILMPGTSVARLEVSPPQTKTVTYTSSL